jgi:hypothetical protein
MDIATLLDLIIGVGTQSSTGAVIERCRLGVDIPNTPNTEPKLIAGLSELDGFLKIQSSGKGYYRAISRWRKAIYLETGKDKGLGELAYLILKAYYSRPATGEPGDLTRGSHRRLADVYCLTTPVDSVKLALQFLNNKAQDERNTALELYADAYLLLNNWVESYELGKTKRVRRGNKPKNPPEMGKGGENPGLKARRRRLVGRPGAAA